ncbi:MAG: hypothetical protein PHS54_01285 [Clostridia bacterium]|nr:hypothetical protein [Clostridia bacterium]
MNIEKEEFNKLKQLDRIEFRQKQDRILKYFSSNFTITFGFFAVLFTLLGYILLFSFGNYISSSSLNYYLNAFALTSRIWIFGIFMAFIMDIVMFLKRKKELKNLEKEYFEINIKEKKKK